MNTCISSTEMIFLSLC